MEQALKSPNIIRPNLINGNGKRTMEQPLALPDRPRPSNFNSVCDRRSCAVVELGSGKKSSTVIETPSPSSEFSRLDISLSAKLPSKVNMTTNFFENPMFGNNELLNIQNSKQLNYASTGIVNPMFNSEFNTKHHENKVESDKTNLFFRHIIPQKYVPNKKNPESSKKNLKFYYGRFSDNLGFKCRLASKIQKLPTVVDFKEPEQSVSDESFILKEMTKSDEEYYSFDEVDEEKVIKILERSNNSQISESQESGFAEDFNEEKRNFVGDLIQKSSLQHQLKSSPSQFC